MFYQNLQKGTALMKKRILTALLMASLLLGSCSETAETEADPAADSAPVSAAEETVEETEPETEIDAKDYVPEIKFDKEMNFLLPDVNWQTRSIIAEELNGERLNDAQYNMKVAMEERFNTTLAEHFTGDIWSANYISNLVTAADDSFDICYALDLYATNYIVNDIALPYTDIAHIDLSRVYWDQSLLKCMTVNNTPYFAFGAYELSYYDFTHVLAFSKDLINNHSLENPYELVNSGKWTLDKMYEMAQVTTFEVDGDGELTVNDSWGYFSEPKQVLPNFWISAGELTIAKDDQDLPYLNITGNDRFFTLFDKMYNIMWDGGIWCSNQAGIDFWPTTAEMFGANRVLFIDEIFFRMKELQDIETDFGIIPYPKYDDSQTEYYSRVEAGCKIAIVPVTNQHPEYAGALLEAMSSYGYTNVIPEFYEIALKRRTSRDEESSAMLDLIFETRRYDLGDTWWCNELRDGVFKTMFADNNRDLASALQSSEKLLNKQLERAIKGFLE